MDNTIRYGRVVMDRHTRAEISRVEVTPDEVRSRDCPACPGKAGEPCRAKIARGHTRSMWKLHRERINLALDAKATP